MPTPITTESQRNFVLAYLKKSSQEEKNLTTLLLGTEQPLPVVKTVMSTGCFFIALLFTPILRKALPFIPKLSLEETIERSASFFSQSLLLKVIVTPNIHRNLPKHLPNKTLSSYVVLAVLDNILTKAENTQILNREELAIYDALKAKNKPQYTWLATQYFYKATNDDSAPDEDIIFSEAPLAPPTRF